MRHITVMSLSNAAGITALFVVDMLDLFFLSILGEKHLAAAVGYASTILFITTSIGIGISIASGSLISRSLGAREQQQARQYMASIAALCLVITSLIAALVWVYIPELLHMVGASGEVHDLACQYLNIMVPSMPVLALAMSFGAALRAQGDAKRSMSSTLLGGAVNALLDPVFIFALGLGIQGAAIASVLARFAIFGSSAFWVIKTHRLISPVNLQQLQRNLGNIMRIALPAILTNLAMPVSSVFVMRAVARYGDAFVAGYAVIGRIVPVAFGVVFALSGAIGPIVGQNYGAGRIDRVGQSLKNAYLFSTLYITGVSILLFGLQGYLISLFGMKGNAAAFIEFFCRYIAISFVFNGVLFVANASFKQFRKTHLFNAAELGESDLGNSAVYHGGRSYGWRLWHFDGAGIRWCVVCCYCFLSFVPAGGTDGSSSHKRHRFDCGRRKTVGLLFEPSVVGLCEFVSDGAGRGVSGAAGG